MRQYKDPEDDDDDDGEIPQGPDPGDDPPPTIAP